jgi:hypothetical protein
MAPQFFSKEIEVTLGGEFRAPLSFRLGTEEYVISDILETWSDYGFGLSPLRRGRWWQRRHRNYYRVKTNQGEVFEIYYDRGTSLEHPEQKKWFLSRQL